MINTNELMLGNWIYFRNELCIVYGVFQGAIQADIRGKGIAIKAAKQDEIEPIPITEEILKKCGFKKYCQKGCFIAYANKSEEFEPMLIFDDGEYHFIGIDRNTQFLHELQNQYFLITGEQLKVNL